jgi:poly-gamma-glutamate capsule biosynthesis protein CapA/YwtB (metallophosphatase superfamily)
VWLVFDTTISTGIGAAMPDSARVRPAVAAIVESVSAEVIFAGDLILGDEVNAAVAQRGPEAMLSAIPSLPDADLTIVNLESAVAADGEMGVEKSEFAPHYFRARPETLAVLQAAGIDAVALANNHSADYGRQALLEQRDLLDDMGIGHVGAGNNRDEACRPIYLDAGTGLTVALFSADATEPKFAAEPRRAGTCHLPLGDRGAWEDRFEKPMSDARDRAHAVLVALHWGENWASDPTDEKRALGQLLIDMGADAILGSNAHELQGVEEYEHGVIVHDAGSLLAPFPNMSEAALFTLTVTQRGIESLQVQPTIVGQNGSQTADGLEAARILDKVAERSAGLGTNIVDGTLSLAPPDRPGPTTQPAQLVPVSEDPGAIAPAAVPPNDCTVQSVPPGAQVDPVDVGPLTMVGASVETDRLLLPSLAWIETYWTISAPIERDLWLVSHAERNHEDLGLWSAVHEPCDWAWPTSRWEVGTIYRDRASLRPPTAALSPVGAALVATGIGGPLTVSVAVEDDGHPLARSSAIGTVELGVPTVWSAAVVGLIVLAISTFRILRRRRGNEAGRASSSLTR